MAFWKKLLFWNFVWRLVTVRRRSTSYDATVGSYGDMGNVTFVMVTVTVTVTKLTPKLDRKKNIGAKAQRREAQGYLIFFVTFFSFRLLGTNNWIVSVYYLTRISRKMRFLDDFADLDISTLGPRKHHKKWFPRKTNPTTWKSVVKNGLCVNFIKIGESLIFGLFFQLFWP